MNKNQQVMCVVGAVVLGCIALAAWGYTREDWMTVGMGAAPVAGLLAGAFTEGAQKMLKRG